MNQSLEEELLCRMKESQYFFTLLNHRSIEKTKNGYYYGFQITKGLWYQLRVFLLKKDGENKLFELVFSEGFGREYKAKNKMHELLQKYKQL